MSYRMRLLRWRTSQSLHSSVVYPQAPRPSFQLDVRALGAVHYCLRHDARHGSVESVARAILAGGNQSDDHALASILTAILLVQLAEKRTLASRKSRSMVADYLGGGGEWRQDRGRAF